MAIFQEAQAAEPIGQVNPTPIGVADPTPKPLPPREDLVTVLDGSDTGGSTGGGGSDTQSNILGSQAIGQQTDTTVQDLYPQMPEGGEFEVPDVADPTGAATTEADLGQGDVATPTDVTSNTGSIVQNAVNEVTSQVGTGEQTSLSAEQQVDAELARILGQDSPLLASARQEAMRMMNARGLTNTSMAAGATYKSMVDAALPMAQQNAAQAFEREMANTQLRQQANQMTAEQTAALRALEAELGQDLAIFNGDQLAEAQRLTAQLRTAMEQQNAQAYNEAAMQLAELQRDAQSQQAALEAAGAEREFLERQAYQEQILDSVAELNKQFMVGEQQIDLQNVIGTYQQITSINSTAAQLMDSYLRSIGQIYATKDMSTSQAAEAVRQMVAMLEGSMRMISEMNGMDFGNTDANIPGGSGGYSYPNAPPGDAPPIGPGDGSVNSAEDLLDWWRNR